MSLSREELGELLLRLERIEPPPTPQELQRRRRQAWFSRYGWFVIWPPAGVVLCLGIFVLWPWVQVNLPVDLGSTGALSKLFVIFAFLAGVLALHHWLDYGSLPHDHPFVRRSWGVAELREGGVWIERPQRGACAVPWEGVQGYAFHPDRPYVILVPTDEQRLALDEAFPGLEFTLSIPTPTEEDRAALLRELAQRGVRDVNRDAPSV